MNWGLWGKNLNTKEMASLIEICLEHHITSFDHADIYGDYTTEAEFGNAFHESKTDRSKIQFISKCGIQHPSSNSPYQIKHYNTTKEHIITSVEKSLFNLKTDYLDLLLLHRPNPLMQADEIAEAIEKLKQEGKIIDFGVSNFSPSQTELIQSRTKVYYNQIQFSITHFDSLFNGDLDYMQIHKIRPMAWSPLGNVFKENTPQTNQLQNILAKMMLQYNTTADVLLLAWILKHPSGILPVTGTASADRLKTITKATTLNLSPEDWFELLESSQGHQVP